MFTRGFANGHVELNCRAFTATFRKSPTAGTAGEEGAGAQGTGYSALGEPLLNASHVEELVAGARESLRLGLARQRREQGAGYPGYRVEAPQGDGEAGGLCAAAHTIATCVNHTLKHSCCAIVSA